MEAKNQEVNNENNNQNQNGGKIMTEKIEQSTETNEVAMGDSNENNTVNQLPEGVTEEPRNEEEMHMKYIKHSSSLVDVYLAVSDHSGEFLGDEKLEEYVISFISEFKDKEFHELDKPAVVISKLRFYHRLYCERLERSGNITDGIQTKSGIRRGMLLNIERKLLRKNGKQWVAHYIETYGKSTLRSAQDYMALAKIPNIIRYAFIGKERLIESQRAIKTLEIEGDDPMATLFEQHSINFDPENSQGEETLTDLKLGIDCAIAVTKIKKAERQNETELGVNPDDVRKLIDNGIAVNSSLINDLFIINGEGNSVIDHINGLLGEDGNGDAMLPHIKKLNEFPKIVADLRGTIESINQHIELARRVKQDDITGLERCISDLKNLIQVDVITDK